jgi:hypothetical protein
MWCQRDLLDARREGPNPSWQMMVQRIYARPSMNTRVVGAAWRGCLWGSGRHGVATSSMVVGGDVQGWIRWWWLRMRAAEDLGVEGMVVWS